jgi:DNA-binding PadR family transcriptional regulator
VPRRPNRSLQTRLVFAALLEQSLVWRHGYDLSKQTDLQSGSLYPILIRLAGQGLLEERWEPAEPGRPPRHVYRLTASGVATAREVTASDERPSMGRLRVATVPR